VKPTTAEQIETVIVDGTDRHGIDIATASVLKNRNRSDASKQHLRCRRTIGGTRDNTLRRQRVIEQ
jgi:hypothetical protein